MAAMVLATMSATAGVSTATHADGFYDQPIIFQYDTFRIDVLVVPPTHGDILHRPYVESLTRADPGELTPFTNTYMRAVLDSIRDWTVGVETFGPGWLKDNLDIRTYVLGQDLLPTDPEGGIEIVVVAVEEINFVWSGAAVVIGEGQAPCIVTNTKINANGESRSYREMYGLNGQEFGHCLGLHHVGNGSDPSTFHPETDVMSYGPLGTTKCVSNLNVRGLEIVFAPAIGRTVSTDPATLHVNAYKQITC